MNDKRRENLFKKLVRVVPKSKRNWLKSAVDIADENRLENLETAKFQKVNIKKSFRGAIDVFATAFGVFLLVLNIVFTMVLSPIFQRYSSFSKRILGDMQLIYANTANYGCIGIESSTQNDTPSEDKSTSSTVLTEPMSAVVKSSEADAAFDEITNELFLGYEYNDFKTLLINDYENIAELDNCRKQYNTLRSNYFNDVNYVNNKSNNYLKYVVELNFETNESKRQKYQDNINTYQEKSDGLTEKYNELIEKQTELKICLQKCIDSRQLMIDYILNNKSSMSDKLKIELYSISTEIQNIGMLQYLTNGIQLIDKYNKSYITEMNNYSAHCTAYSDAVVKLADLNADYEKKYEYYQTAITNFNGFIESYVVAIDQYVALEFDYNSFNEEYKQFLDDYNLNYEGSSNDKKAEYDATKTQYENRNRQFAQRKLEIEDNISYLKNVLSTFGLSNYVSSVKNKIEATNMISKLYQDLEVETDSEKIEAINTQIADQNKIIETAEKTIEENQTKIALINEMLSTDVWTEEYYTTICVEYKQIQKPTDEQKDEYNLKKTTYETVQNALISLSARATEKQNILSEQISVSTLTYTITVDTYNGSVAYYNTEHALINLQNALNLLPDLYGAAADGFQKIIDNVDNAMNVNQKTHEQVVKDLSLKEVYSDLRSYSDTAQTISLNTLLFEDFDITVLGVTENHTVIANELYNKLKTEVSTFETAMASINSTENKAHQLSIDYYTTPNGLFMYILTIDIIASVIYACYFVYLIYAAVSENKEDNYKTISGLLND